MSALEIPGYTYGTKAVAKSPVTPEELANLEQAVGMTDQDRRYLRLAGDVLVWQGILDMIR